MLCRRLSRVSFLEVLVLTACFGKLHVEFFLNTITANGGERSLLDLFLVPSLSKGHTVERQEIQTGPLIMFTLSAF